MDFLFTINMDFVILLDIYKAHFCLVADLLSTWAMILFDTSIFGIVYMKKKNVVESGCELGLVFVLGVMTLYMPTSNNAEVTNNFGLCLTKKYLPFFQHSHYSCLHSAPPRG